MPVRACGSPALTASGLVSGGNLRGHTLARGAVSGCPSTGTRLPVSEIQRGELLDLRLGPGQPAGT